MTSHIHCRFYFHYFVIWFHLFMFFFLCIRREIVNKSKTWIRTIQPDPFHVEALVIIRRWVDRHRNFDTQIWAEWEGGKQRPTMASLSLSLSSPFTLSSSTTNLRQRSRRRISTTLRPPAISHNSWRHRHIICMAPEEEKMTRRSPLDFPIVSLLLHLFLLGSIQALVYALINYCLATEKAWERKTNLGC